MQPAVIVEIHAADAAPSSVQALLDGCEIGMHGEARCLLGPAPSGTEWAADAVVAWDGPDVQVAVELHEGGARKTRTMQFADADPVLERWRTTGFAVATMVGDALADRQIAVHAEESPPAAQVAPPPLREAVVRAPEPSLPRWWIDGRFSAARGAEDASVALGGELALSRSLGGPWFLSGALGLTSQRSQGVELLRPSVAFGLGILAPRIGDQLSFSRRVQPRLEAIDASGHDASGATGHAVRAALGLGEGVDAAWMASDWFGFVGGVALEEFPGPTDITEHGQVVTVLPALDLLLHVGVRYGLP
jgi:hypothetical protein